jgi:heptosyltransferase-3
LSLESSTAADVQNLKYKNILVTRTDRIGDVVLTLPVVEVLRKEFPQSKISFLARKYTAEIVEGKRELDQVVLYDTPEGEKPFFRMLAELRKAEFDVAIVAFPRFRLALLLWLARIPTRIGSGYRWYSALFNERVYEHRKAGHKHEFEHNLSLLKPLGCDVSNASMPRLEIAEESIQAAAAEMKRIGCSGSIPVAVLHPGSGGSARDWSPRNFGLLAHRLCDAGWDVVVTGAKGEEILVSEVVQQSGGTAKYLVGILTLKTLAAVIKASQLFVSNSTGPLHIAAAVGTPVIGMYPPIEACSPHRWGPVTEKKFVFVPDRTQCSQCKGGPCRSNVCMDQIDVREVADAAFKLAPIRTTIKKIKSRVIQ